VGKGVKTQPKKRSPEILRILGWLFTFCQLLIAMKKIFLPLLLLCLACTAQETSNFRPVDLVYPHLDAANSRWFFFSSACRPFGMVNLSPDNQTGGAWGSGYRYHTDTIKGFSHIHAWQMAGVSVMPVTFDRKPQEILEAEDYFSAFSHDGEVVQPGYHKVVLDRYQTEVELTSTTRVGLHRYQFPANQKNAVLVNLQGLLGPSRMGESQFQALSKTEFNGYVDNLPTRRRPKDLRVYFHIVFNRPVQKAYRQGEGSNINLLTFKPDTEPLLMKVAISYTSVEGAHKNLEAELNHWDFERVVLESQEEWNELLSRIEIEGGTQTEQRRFYTDLWHALQGRRIISDADGRYIDNTGESPRVGQLPLDEDGKPQFNHYNSDSFWGAQWTLNTLWHLVYPEISEEFCRSLLQYYQDGGTVPRGPSGGNYTYVMTGASSTPFLVSAWMKGIRGFDGALAYEALKKNHLSGGIMAKAGYEHKTLLGGGLDYFIEQGHVPYPIPEGNFGYHQDGPSLTMEYAYQDWTLAQLAQELGQEEDYAYFMKRSQNYAHVFDPESGWMRPKDAQGNWKEPFDPYEYNAGFNESNGAQHTWFVPHDLMGLAELMGGAEAAVNKLNTQFETAEKLGYTSGTSHDQELNPEFRRIPINYGNQPSIQTAFVFNHLGRPDLTQYWARKVSRTVYGGLSPETGYNGDEDQGLMGSLAVLMKLGLFEMTGGTDREPVVELGSPWFDQATIQLNQDYYPGKTFVIEAQNNGPENCYIQEAKLNGQAVEGYAVPFAKVVAGGKLVLRMSAEQ
jgi:predicted alpha-1,2-mannosidase